MANKCTEAGKEDVTFATFVPTSPSDAALPVFLFQSGYGSSSVGHKPLMEAIASKGYICVIPDRAGDSEGGKEAVGALFGEGKTVSALSSDGTYLGAALAWVKAQETIGGFKPDLTKIAAGGFSMGGIEVIKFCAANGADVKACIGVDPSTQEMCEGLYLFKQAELREMVGAFKMPSLWIGSDKSVGNGEAKAMYEAATATSAYVCFKDEVLDNSMALTDATSIWSPAIDEQVPGIKQHFALAAEKGVVSDVPILAFLGKVFGGADAPLAAPEAVAESLAK